MRKQLFLEGQCSALGVAAARVKAGALISRNQRAKISKNRKTTADEATKILMPYASVQRA